MGEVGELLRESREHLGLSLEEMAVATRINPSYLEALENENYEALPHLTVARGFLRNYASALNLDVDHVLELVDGQAQPHKRNRRRATLSEDGIRMKSIPVSTPSRLISADLLVGLLLIAVLILMLGGVYYVYQDRLPSLNAALTPQAPVATVDTVFILPTPTPAPTFTPTPTVTPTPLYYAGVTVELAIQQESWVQVSVDGSKVYEGILKPGEERHWSGDNQVALRVGNAGGVEAIVNGESTGLLGEPGQVLDRVYVKLDDGMAAELTPTPTLGPDQETGE